MVGSTYFDGARPDYNRRIFTRGMMIPETDHKPRAPSTGQNEWLE
jgi:hypothetical protein